MADGKSFKKYLEVKNLEGWKEYKEAKDKKVRKMEEARREAVSK